MASSADVRISFRGGGGQDRQLTGDRQSLLRDRGLPKGVNDPGIESRRRIAEKLRHGRGYGCPAECTEFHRFVEFIARFENLRGQFEVPIRFSVRPAPAGAKDRIRHFDNHRYERRGLFVGNQAASMYIGPHIAMGFGG